MADPNEGVTITFREVYDEIVGMRGDVRSLTETRENTRDILEDHESRMRALERWKYGIPVATLTGVVGIVAAVLGK